MNFNKLLEQSQFHGGRRLADKKCRWLWSLSMLLLFGSAVTVIASTIARFFDNPTFMVQMAMVPTAMEFPSVFVCPEVMYRDDKIDRFLNHVKIPPSLNYTYLKEVMVMLAAFVSPDISYRTRDLVNLEYLLKYNKMDVDTAGRLLTTSCRSTFLKCRWENEIVNCSTLFNMELTGDGYCCVFNGLSLREDKDGHRSKNKWYVERFGFGTGLMLVVNQSQSRLSDIDLSYKWIALQTSQHYVESTVNGTALSPGTEQWLKYHFQNFQIDEDAKGLNHKLRKCNMAYTPLKFFPVYHKRYCILECEAAHTLKRCNCVSLVHPRPKGAPYCTARKLLCAQHARVSYDSDACNCLPACDVATDFVTINSFELHQDVQPIDSVYDNLDYSKVTIVRIFMRYKEIKTNMRWSYFSNIDLFAQLGGVFNMFFGCSILTLLEVVILAYHLFRPTIFQRQSPIKFKFTNAVTKTLKNSKKKIRI